MKKKEKTIKLSELKECYIELCASLHPMIQFELDNTEAMARQAIFVKDKAINGICRFLFNKGINE